MTRLWVLRHGRTAWNAQRRLQGRTDVPLDEVGRRDIGARRLPADVARLPAISSPLIRARETAQALCSSPLIIEPALTEMDWGQWEGKTVAELRASMGEAMRANEDRGLDFRPEGGESPREVQLRLHPWLRATAVAGGERFVVTHKGVIRAMLALAHGWNMRGRAPVRLDFACLQGFDLNADGDMRLAVVNRPLESRESRAGDCTATGNAQ